jgi:hypothetical protein
MMDKKAVRTAVEDIKEERGRAEAFIQLRKRKREGSVLSESERNLLQEMSEEKKEEEKGSKTKDRKSGSSSWLSRKELEEKLEERIKICEVVLQNSGLSPDLYRAIGVKSGKDQREQVVDKKRHFQEKLDKLKSDKGLSSAERVLLGAELVGGRDRPRGG